MSLVPHPLHHHPPALTQRGATESGVQSAEGGRGNWSPSGRGLRRWRAAAAVAVGGRVSAIPHSSWEAGPAPAGGPGLSKREALLWPRRPRASPLPVWALCPPPPAPGLLLVWPSQGVCHTGSCVHPAPRKTQDLRDCHQPGTSGEIWSIFYEPSTSISIFKKKLKCQSQPDDRNPLVSD